jgi:periplasmic protein TonB
MERRLFEDLVESDVVAHKGRKGYTLPVSVAVHIIVLVVVVVVPLLSSGELPEPTTAVKAFFVEPAAPPPPPPPPPPPAPRAPDRPRPVTTPPPTSTTFTAPTDVVEKIEEESIDLGVEGGVAGGVEGGVAGGVVGGVVGGLPDAPPPTEPIRVGGNIKDPKKLKHVQPNYPAIARQARVQGVVIVECTISPQGRVVDAKVLRSLPLLDQAALDAVRQWVFTPTLLNGVPVPVIMTVTVNFTLQ